MVNAAANKLNKTLIDLDYDPAEEKYIEAESLMLLEDYAGAINGFYIVHKTYPGSPFAPKALYTCGWILENELFLLDSAATYCIKINCSDLNLNYTLEVHETSSVWDDALEENVQVHETE